MVPLARPLVTDETIGTHIGKTAPSGAVERLDNDCVHAMIWPWHREVRSHARFVTGFDGEKHRKGLASWIRRPN